MRNFTFVFLVLVAVVHVNAQPTDSILYYFTHYNYEKVVEKVDRQLIDQPENAKLYFEKAKALKELYKVAEAIESIEQALKMDTAQIAYWYLLADINIIADQNNKSIAAFKHILEIDSTLIHARFKLADIYFKSKDYFSAIDEYLTVYNYDTNNFLALRKAAQSFEKIETLPAFIIPMYRKVLMLNPDDKISKYRISSLLLKQNLYEEAIDELHSFIQTDSTDTQFLKHLGFAYLNLHEFTNSIFNFERCLVLGDTSFFVHKYLGIASKNALLFELAKDKLEKAISYKTDDYQVLYYLGMVYGDLGEYNKSIECLNDALKILRSNDQMIAKVYNGLAMSYDALNDRENTINNYKLALEYDRSIVDIYYMLGLSYYHVKDNGQALKYLNMYIDSSQVYENKRTKYVESSKELLKTIAENEFWEGRD